MSASVMLAYATPRGMAHYESGSGLRGAPTYTLGTQRLAHQEVLDLMKGVATMQPTRQRNYHPSGDDHWTRQPGVKRESWGKLKPEKRAELIARVNAGERADDLAREYRIGRTTAWRYLRKEGLVKTRLVSSVPRQTP